MASLLKMKYKVVLVPFPFDDLSSSKVRPAVCLTDPIGPHRHIVLAFITSRTPTDLLATDLVIDSHNVDFSTTGLRVSSTLQLHRLMTATTSFLQRELGELSPNMQKQVADRLKTLFDLE
jgi:mRNA interferase MazF